MTSDIFEQIGLGNLDIAYLFIGLTVILLILLLMVGIQIKKMKKLEKAYQKFMTGKNADSLEKEISGLYEDNNLLKRETENNRKDIRVLYKNFEKAFQKVGVVKYDAFQQMGGLLSFSLALLNENNDGFILNSVHSSDGCYTYTKEIHHGKCDIELGNEEKVALDQAMNI